MGQDARGMPPCADGGIATAEEGLVLLDGPNGVALSMTPDAAQQTAEQLVAAAAEARRQQAPGSAATRT